MKLLRRIYISLSVVLFAICCGAILLFSVSATGWKALDVPTGSMRPTVSPGSLTVVHRVPVTSLRVGEVITYTNPLKPQTTITHRITRVFRTHQETLMFQTKGDANKVPDPPIVNGLVQGKVVWHVPHVGSWLIWGKQPIGLLIMIYTPALFMMAGEVKRMADYLKSLQPYRVPGFSPAEPPVAHHRKVVTASVIGATFAILGLFIWQPALALLQSNTVALGPNHITVAVETKPPVSQCSSSNNVSVNNNSNQTAESGNASATGNTTTGSVSSGSASTTISSSTNISVSSNC